MKLSKRSIVFNGTYWKSTVNGKFGYDTLGKILKLTISQSES